MRKLVARIAFYSSLVLILLAVNGAARRFYYNDVESVSDGLTNGLGRQKDSFLHFKRMDSSEEQCRQIYGFLPCSSNLPGHIFLIVIYEYLLYHGESYAGGDGRIFHVFSSEVAVSIFCQLLDSLPESLILLVSGLLSSNEDAQEYVVTGVGLLAGSSILLLTVLWGICLICAQRPYLKADSRGFAVSFIQVDFETSEHAKLMLVSVIPLIFILIPMAYGVSYPSQEDNYVALLVAIFCLLYYFYYQYTHKWIPKRILEYAELERMIEMHVPYHDVQALIRKRDTIFMELQIDMEYMMNGKLDIDMLNGRIDMTRYLMDDPYTDYRRTEFNQVAQLLRQDKIKLMKLIKDILGGRDEDRLFDDITGNKKDSSISRSDLEAFIQNQYIDQEIHHITDELVDIIMVHLDADRNEKIDRDEFKSRAKKWLRVIDQYVGRSRAENERTSYVKATTKASKHGRFKAIALLVLGILMLTVLVEPLTQSVRIFSESMKIAPFYVSFILVPLATNARTAIAAIIAAKQKRRHTTSLTFSQIYHKVFMNNVLGFSVLVSVIYFRGLTWHFSAEVLVLVIVCVLMGLYASFITIYPILTFFLVFPLYPLSLVLVYYVNDTFTFTEI